MIELYKASAGSGKTYTLAQRFIYYLISVRNEDTGRRRLRHDKEIEDSVSHILAITFTNKATNEMKERIVERLADLAGRKQDIDETDYLKGYMASLDASEEQVRHACGKALAELLINYSDFHVSTIDSFFQSVLRTFAYESDLNDTYQVEIDTKWSSRVGVDATLSSINAAKPDEEVHYWLSLLMDAKMRDNAKFDIFQKREGRKSEYAQMLSRAEKLESEEFKQKREELDQYFSEPGVLRKAYEAYMLKYEGERERLIAICKQKAESGKTWIESLPEVPKGKLNGNHLSRLCKALANDFSFKADADKDKADFFSSDGRKVYTDEVRAETNRLLYDFYQAWGAIKDYEDSEDYRLWKQYGKMLPYMGLLQAIRRNSATFFETNNVVQLSETNSLLSRVIGDDDTPFIYERIGAWLNHFLIDEFQDTSRMQWQNLRPLLSESDSRGCENLIIGDAKQSIYRFRNADPSIIRSTVPGEFPAHISRGDDPSENTNYRSRHNIVLFNNALFRELAQRIDDLGQLKTFLTPLYSNVVQQMHPGDGKDGGYVSVEFIPEAEQVAPDGMKLEYEDTVKYPKYYQRIIDTITDIIGRGYRMGDIGILVRTNKESDRLVSAFLAYNRSLRPDDEDHRLRFVSEESLKISAAESVGIIITALEMFEKYGMEDVSDTITFDETHAEEDKDNNKNKNKSIKDKRSVYGLASAFNFFAMSHKGVAMDELVKKFFEERTSIDFFEHLRPWMQSGALPAVVEAIIGVFVPKDLLVSEAPYIAAFQDIVSEQCERYATDAASFMQWWRRHGVNKTLSSPEGIDAIAIMTTHKAKGLAFDFVFVPDLGQKAYISGNIQYPEWRWVKPHLPALTVGGRTIALPPYVPIELDSQLFKLSIDTKVVDRRRLHLDLFDDYIDTTIMDNLNTAYVALTRPVKELYIMAQVHENDPKKNKDLLGHVVYNMIQTFPSEEVEGCLAPGSLSADETGMTFTLGEKAPGADVEKAQEEARKEKKRMLKEEKIRHGKMREDRRESKVEEVGVDGYDIFCREKPFEYREEQYDIYDEDDPDPRAFGNQLHKLLEWIRVPSDLPKALRRMRISGEADSNQLETYRAILEKSLASEEGRRWFAPDLKVLTERPLLKQGMKQLRPDRIVVRDGHAVIIDYKFGKEQPKYLRKIKDYCRLLQLTGLFKSIEGYLWYIPESKSVMVCHM